MRIVFALGVVGLFLLELALVYFIMPLPESQRMESIEAAGILAQLADISVDHCEVLTVSGPRVQFAVLSSSSSNMWLDIGSILGSGTKSRIRPSFPTCSRARLRSPNKARGV